MARSYPAVFIPVGKPEKIQYFYFYRKLLCYNVQSMNFRKHIFVFIILGCILTGCSTPQKRSLENPAAFNALSVEQKELVLNSKIEAGLSEDAVYIALDQPAYVRKGQLDGEEITSWVYTKMEGFTVPTYRPVAYTDNEGKVHVSEVYEPEYRSRPVPNLIIMFKDGVVIGWQNL